MPIPTEPTNVVVESLLVEDAKIPAANQIGVEVELVVTPKLVVGSNGKAAERPEPVT